MIARTFSRLLIGSIGAGVLLFLLEEIGAVLEPRLVGGYEAGFSENLYYFIIGKLKSWQPLVQELIFASAFSAFVIGLYGWISLKLKVKLRFWLAVPITVLIGFFFTPTTFFRPFDWLQAVYDPQNHLYEIFTFVGFVIVAGIAVRLIDYIFSLAQTEDDETQRRVNFQHLNLIFSRLLLGGVIGGLLQPFIFYTPQLLDGDLIKEIGSLGNVLMASMPTAAGRSVFALMAYGWFRYRLRWGFYAAFLVALTPWSIAYGDRVIRMDIHWNTILDAMVANTIVSSFAASMILGLVAVLVFRGLKREPKRQKFSDEQQSSVLSES